MSGQGSGTPPLVRIRARHRCEFVWNRYVKAKALAERRRKLRIPRFRPRAKSSLTPLLLLSPPNPPDGWASAGAPIGGTYGVRLSYFFFILSSLFFSSASPARGGGAKRRRGSCRAVAIFHRGAPQGDFLRCCCAPPPGRSRHEAVENQWKRTLFRA